MPAEFAQWCARTGGEAARQWLEELPHVVRDMCRQWQLEIDDPAPLHGGLGLVLLVLRGPQRCALKLSWREGSVAGETLALRTWRGNGAVQLLEAQPDRGALLLERLDPRRSLHTVDLWQAAGIAGGLIRQLA
ncbi:aminoglycoside phosphotransferase family protein, partial [Allorhizocola rhizosphaerae]|uniref:aminoglycoside phosphotransferase family protein n=1 Tax=Allorhizocola rhizosphaerae TaxID=1872709 RepID=UPI001FE88675